MNSWRDLRPLERMSLTLLSLALVCVILILALRGCAGRADVTVVDAPEATVRPDSLGSDTVVVKKPGRKPRKAAKPSPKPRIKPIERNHLDEGAGR